MKRFFLLFLVLTLLVTTGLGCGGSSQAEQLANTPVSLTIWRVFDDDDTFRDLMNGYRAIHPNVSFTYRELRYDEYEEELLEAFAEGSGPDIFSLHNTWIGKYENIITPMPASVTIPYTETRGNIKKETVTTLKQEPTMSERELENMFIEVVVDDVLRDYQATTSSSVEQRIFGLPLAVDTMVLYYNRDLLNAAGIAEPAPTWTTFQEHVTELAQIGENDAILQSGAALGTGENVERAFDIISLLMLQNGTEMLDARGRATFASETDDLIPGLDALYFYTDFANPLKQVYTWNEDQVNSFESFTNGQAAYFFGYAYHVPLIEAVNSKLNYSVASVPQIEGGRTVTYANYWVETVSKATPFTDWAWDFILYAAEADHVVSYLNAAQKPTALRSLINDQMEDDVMYPFASQLLTAQSWYRGEEVSVAEEAFADLVEIILSGSEDPSRALRDAQNKVNQSL